MGAITMITRFAMIAGSAAAIYVAGLSFQGKAPEIVAQGFVKPEYLKFYQPKNSAGETEIYLMFERADLQVALPIRDGPHGPIVGSAEYNWKSITEEEKSNLVVQNWSTLQTDARKLILKNELENLIEAYGVK